MSASGKDVDADAPRKDARADAPPKDAPAAATSGVIANPWSGLRRFTPARIALGRSGVSQPTAPHLAFQLAHAQARDAVHHALDVPALAADLAAIGLRSVALHSAAPDRATYLRRPDLGRALTTGSLERLRAEAAALAADERIEPGEPAQPHERSALNARDEPNAREGGHEPNGAGAWSPGKPPSDDRARAGRRAGNEDEAHRLDLVFVAVDGLSARAVQRHAVPLLAAVLQRLKASPSPWRTGPVTLVEQARVAIGDEIGACVGAALAVVLIGERPGLSSPDSLGLYITWDPRPGRLDAERNCISNVRPEGLSYAEAACRLGLLLDEARRRRLTGVKLKDESEAPLATPEARPNFLIG